MNKPRVLAIDWKSANYYKSVQNIVDIELMLEYLGCREGLAAIVMHNPCPCDSTYLAIEDAMREDIPIILDCAALPATHKLLERKYCKYDKLYFVNSYPEMFKLIQEIFGKQN